MSIKKIIDDLPRQNYALLKDFCGMAKLILEKSNENLMNSKNLSVCIAPNVFILYFIFILFMI